MKRSQILLCFSGACFGCTAADIPQAPPATSDPLPGLASIEITPADRTLFVRNGAPVGQDYQATGHFLSGPPRDITPLVTWSVDPTLAAFPAGAHLEAKGFRGGQTQVRGRAGAIEGAAQLAVVIQADRVAGTAPADSATHFAGVASPALAPTVVYPNDGVLLPPNLGTIEFQWQPVPGTDLYDIHLMSPFADLHVYTTEPKYTPSSQEWRWLSETNRGGRVTYVVSATALAGAGVGAGAVRAFAFATDDTRGGLYYWSTTGDSAAEGIWRFDFGRLDVPAQRYYGESDAGHCVGCHVLTRDGSRMSVTDDGGDGATEGLEVASRTAYLPRASGIYSSFTTFSPDGSRMVTTLEGTLTLRDSASGAALGDLPTGGRATHPDWSPDGTRLVYVLAQAGSQRQDWRIESGSLEILDYNGGAWGMPRPLISSQGENNYYPQFSPDGQWIVFNRAASDATGNGSYDNPAAEVWVVKADGSGAPIRLAAAHDGPSMTDSWPRWSPFVQSVGPPEAQGLLYWVTVSSKRAYGFELGAGVRPQLWMFAFSPMQPQASGGDGSWPAFWLPFQDLQTRNHIGQWTTQIVRVP